MVQRNYLNFFNGALMSLANKILMKQIDNDIKHASGIYRIVNNITGDCYIGQTKDLANRKYEHMRLLKNDKHIYTNGERSLLQKAWNKYGEDNFTFDVIEYCNIDELDDRERFWVDFYQCNFAKTRHGYNLTDGGQPHNREIPNMQGRIRVHNNQVEKVIFEEELEEYIALGFTRGVLPSRVVKGEQHYMYGKHVSDERKQLLRQKFLGRVVPNWVKVKVSIGRMKPIVQLTKQYEFVRSFGSGLEAEQETGISRSHISQSCNHKRKTAGGFVWRFKEEYDSGIQEW